MEQKLERADYIVQIGSNTYCTLLISQSGNCCLAAKMQKYKGDDLKLILRRAKGAVEYDTEGYGFVCKEKSCEDCEILKEHEKRLVK
jgi:hypothetical protein